MNGCASICIHVCGGWGWEVGVCVCVYIRVCAHAFVIMLECAELSCMYLYLLTCECYTSFYETTNRGS